ncbi:MAG TPA: tRNA (adenosine(37)-N6)-threonylcarbamoyltransferase complex dimerization subunit type 1 TsaB [Marinobacter sp.]|nr:tRNA (adenosine(37)-N6)-threonylcarbamoyltransferase complex dimerization subunit type 1 TsaB [Marinobacter sp.]
MNLLALDTSSSGCSAALLTDGQLTERFELAPRGHTRLLMPMVRELLAQAGMAPADLDALAFARGPGSFTGLRIATGVVQGMAWGLDLPAVPVSSLQAVALSAIETHGLSDGDGIAVAFDARMGEVYMGVYSCEGQLPVALAEERVCPPEAVTLPESGPQRWVAAGSGWAFREAMAGTVVERLARVDESLLPRASAVARLAERAFLRGETVTAEQAQPVYVRDEVSWQKLPGRK